MTAIVSIFKLMLFGVVYLSLHRHPRFGSKTRWTSQSTRFTPRWTPSLQERPPLSTSQLASGTGMTQQNFAPFVFG